MAPNVGACVEQKSFASFLQKRRLLLEFSARRGQRGWIFSGRQNPRRHDCAAAANPRFRWPLCGLAVATSQRRGRRETPLPPSCITSSMVMASACQMRWSSICKRTLVNASRAPKGSCSSRISGRATRPRAMATRCAMPPERSPGIQSKAWLLRGVIADGLVVSPGSMTGWRPIYRFFPA